MQPRLTKSIGTSVCYHIHVEAIGRGVQFQASVALKHRQHVCSPFITSPMKSFNQRIMQDITADPARPPTRPKAQLHIMFLENFDVGASESDLQNGTLYPRSENHMARESN